MCVLRFLLIFLTLFKSVRRVCNRVWLHFLPKLFPSLLINAFFLPYFWPPVIRNIFFFNLFEAIVWNNEKKVFLLGFIVSGHLWVWTGFLTFFLKENTTVTKKTHHTKKVESKEGRQLLRSTCPKCYTDIRTSRCFLLISLVRFWTPKNMCWGRFMLRAEHFYTNLIIVTRN